MFSLMNRYFGDGQKIFLLRVSPILMRKKESVFAKLKYEAEIFGCGEDGYRVKFFSDGKLNRGDGGLWYVSREAGRGGVELGKAGY